MADPHEPVPPELAVRLHQLDREIPAAEAELEGASRVDVLRELRAERAALAAAATGNGLALEDPQRSELPAGCGSHPRELGPQSARRQPLAAPAWTRGYIERQRERRTEREMRPEKLLTRLGVTQKRRETFFYLSGQRLAAETAARLVDELPRLAPQVRDLYLGQALYELGEKGWAPVAALLRTHPLNKVYLGSNDLGDAGVTALAEALKAEKGNSTLQLLELAENAIDDEGARQLSTLLHPQACPCLSGLHLRGNLIGDTGARALLQGLRRMPALSWLDLGGNPIIDKDVWRERGELLERNKARANLLPCQQRLCFAMAGHHRLGRASGAYLLSPDLAELVGTMPPPSVRGWNGQKFLRSESVGVRSSSPLPPSLSS